LQAAGALVGVDAFAGGDSMCGCGRHNGWFGRPRNVDRGLNSLRGGPMPILASAAKQVAEKCAFRPSGVKTPGENADFMSCLKARPTKLKSFSTTSKAASRRSRYGRAEARPSMI
jgi:hypothetical protein